MYFFFILSSEKRSEDSSIFPPPQHKDTVPVMEWTVYPQNLYVEALTSRIGLLGDWAFIAVIKLKWGG